MPKAEVLVRLGLASARMGDKEAAAYWLTKYASVGGARPSSEVFDLVLADVAESTKKNVAAGAATENWPMQLGGPSRNGHMRPLPGAATARTLTEAWVYNYTLAAAEGVQQNPWGNMMGSMGLHGRPMTLPGRNVAAVARDPLVSQWRRSG